MNCPPNASRRRPATRRRDTPLRRAGIPFSALEVLALAMPPRPRPLVCAASDNARRQQFMLGDTRIPESTRSNEPVAFRTPDTG
jgi:hypothetical protein